MSSRNSWVSLRPEITPVDAVAGGPLEQRVVDVGDVLHVVHPVAAVQPHPVDQVEGQVGGGVAEVGGVVGVMPQTYIVAVCPGAVGRTWRSALS